MTAPTFPLESIRTHFGSLDDPRMDRTKLHLLLDIIVIAVCAILCGADTWVEVEAFGNAKLKFLSGGYVCILLGVSG